MGEGRQRNQHIRSAQTAFAGIRLARRRRVRARCHGNTYGATFPSVLLQCLIVIVIRLFLLVLLLVIILLPLLYTRSADVTMARRTTWRGMMLGRKTRPRQP